MDAAEEKGWLGKNLDGVRARDEKFQWSWETPVVVGQLLETASYAVPGAGRMKSFYKHADHYITYIATMQAMKAFALCGEIANNMDRNESRQKIGYIA
ncbi:MAG: hypothetical protein NTW52_00985 [Planctomycetota bacterium]|nr:hypothetical protein [Planctomycetota bacterium]